MNLLGTQYTLNYRAYEIYLAGCKGDPHCKGCHNPTSWDFSIGKLLDDKEMNIICNKIVACNDLVQNIWILGGEPLDQKMEELVYFIKYIKEQTKTKAIWLFTRYNLNEVTDKLSINIGLFDFIKCGRYDETLKIQNHKEYGIPLATSNQHIFQKGLNY